MLTLECQHVVTDLCHDDRRQAGALLLLLLLLREGYGLRDGQVSGALVPARRPHEVHEVCTAHVQQLLPRRVGLGYHTAFDRSTE